MNLQKITNIGYPNYGIRVVESDDNSKFRYCYLNFFNVTNICDEYEINLDNVVCIKTLTFLDRCNLTWGKNPLHKHWYDDHPKEIYMYTPSGKSIDVAILYITDGRKFYVDPKTTSGWRTASNTGVSA